VVLGIGNVAKLEIYPADGGACISQIPCGENTRSSRYQVLAVSADGRTIAAVTDREVYPRPQGRYVALYELQVWDRATGKALWHAPLKLDGPALALSRDGRTVAAYVDPSKTALGAAGAQDGTERSICLLDTATGIARLAIPCAAIHSAFNDSGDYFAALAFNDTGDYLAAFDSQKLRIIRSGDGAAIQSFSIPQADSGGSPLTKLVIRFHPDGNLVGFVRAHYKQIEVFIGNLADGRVAKVLQWRDSLTADLSPDLKILFVGDKSMYTEVILRYDLATGGEIRDP